MIPEVFLPFLSSLGLYKNNCVTYKDTFDTVRFHVLNLSKEYTMISNRINIILFDDSTNAIKKRKVLNSLGCPIVYFIIAIKENQFLIKKRAVQLMEKIDKFFVNNFLINLEKKSGINYLMYNLIFNSHYINDNSSASNTFLERYDILQKIN